MEVHLQPLQERKALRQEFTDRFGKTPQFIAYAPGRVNLIGEHTDYNLLPVFPISITHRIYLAVRPAVQPVVRVINMAAEFTPAEIRLDEPIYAAPAHWTNYMRAALAYLQEHLRGETGAPLRGMDVLVDSDLPPAAGLSSSSALVIATCMAALRIQGQQWQPQEMAERMAKAEKFVGTAGGGMDQAAIAMGELDGALRIEFDPLRVRPVPLPDVLRVFIINSGQRAEKSGAARFHYNRRSLECAVATCLLAQNSLAPVGARQWATLRDVYDWTEKAGIPRSALLLNSLPPDPLPVADMRDRVGKELFDELCRARHLDPTNPAEWLPDGRLQVFARASHVLAEAERVYAFEKALEQNDLISAAYLAQASHASCRDLYHISTPRLEELVEVGLHCGAAAVRVTGAGFGGSLIALVAEDAADGFKVQMEQRGIFGDNLIEARPGGPAGTMDFTRAGAGS